MALKEKIVQDIENTPMYSLYEGNERKGTLGGVLHTAGP